MKIEIVKLSEITPYYNNPRDNANAVAPTMESIKRYGFNKPITCDKEGVIITGHTRYIAAYQLGMTKVPVIFSDMSDELAKRFRIADNLLAEKSEYDEDELIEELKKMGVPEEMQAFFFEDITTMLNFDFDDFSAPAPDMDFEAGGEEDYGGYEEQNLSEEAESYEEVEEDSTEEDEEEDPADGLYQVRIIDGKRMMKVVCPFCGNIETVEVN